MEHNPNHECLDILLVDDDEDDLQLLHEALRINRACLTVHTITDGEKLMTYLSHCNGNTPDLIFLDLNMPRKNGMECLVAMRADPSLKDTIIAIYSTSSNTKEADSAYLAGANIFITKPNTYEALKKIVADVLSTDWHYTSTATRREHYAMS